MNGSAAGGLFHQDYMSLFSRRDGGGSVAVRDCACGARHILRTQSVLFGRGVLAKTAEEAGRRLGADRRLWLLSDERTEAAAGAALKNGLRGCRIAEKVPVSYTHLTLPTN